MRETRVVEAVSPASNAVQRRGVVVFNRSIGRDTFQIRIHQPEIAAAILPGQFVMLRDPRRSDPLLARPFAMYDTTDDASGSPVSLDLVYLVMGNGTRSLSSLTEGATVDLWGPLGNTFPVAAEAPLDRLMIVAGGIGQTPFVSVIKELLGQRAYGSRVLRIDRPSSITVAWGARSAEYLGGLEDFRRTGVDVQVATDDGSAGSRGFVTDLLEQAIASDRAPTAIFSCGPEPMLERVCAIAEKNGIPCWVSLETKMACGYGVCFSCVCPVREDTGWDYRRVCLEGPVFPAQRIAWPA